MSTRPAASARSGERCRPAQRRARAVAAVAGDRQQQAALGLEALDQRGRRQADLLGDGRQRQPGRAGAVDDGDGGGDHGVVVDGLGTGHAREHT
jgi:hypothetical protein